MDAEKTLLGILEQLNTKQDAEELVAAVKVALDLFLELRDANIEDRADILARFQALKSRIDERLAQIKDGAVGPQGIQGAQGPRGERGEKGDRGERGETGSQGVAGNIKDLSPEEIRNALELLIGDERLDASAIKGLEELIKKLVPKQNGSGATGLIGRGRIHNYDLSPYLDGVTKTFNIPAVWGVISVAASSAPGILRPVIDYSWTPQTITFTDAILAAGTLEQGQTVVLVLEDA